MKCWGKKKKKVLRNRKEDQPHHHYHHAEYKRSEEMGNFAQQGMNDTIEMMKIAFHYCVMCSGGQCSIQSLRQK